MKMKRILFAALALFLVACSPPDDDDRIRLYDTARLGPGLDEAEVEALDHLGPTLLDKGVNFGVYSANATRIDLLLFDDPESETPTQQFEMKRVGDVWNLYVEGVGVGQHYGYIAWGPNWKYDPEWHPGTIDGFEKDVDEAGNRFNPNKLLIDPYAKVIHRDHDWSKGSLASGPDRTVSTFAAASKSVVVESNYEWSKSEKEWREKRKNGEPYAENEHVVYEVHLKGFTRDPASGVTHPGTYSGFAEKAEYLADLGVTAVELLPIHEKPLDGGYWGYNNINFFAPEISYAATDDPLEVIDEFKAMVDELHKHDIEVWVDVVYNHTGEGGLWREKIELNDTNFGSEELINHDPHEVAGLYSFRGLDNASYYALSADGETYWNNTGVGNQTRSNHAPMRNLIIDSLRYYVEEMHVDGFRFDLAPVLAEKDQFYNEWDVITETVVQDIIDDPVLQEHNTRIVAEPWSLQGFYLGQFPKSTEGDAAWGSWNAHFRDVWRAFINWDDRALNSKEGPIDIGGALTGSYDLYGDDERNPFHSYNFITVHDGFTMYDLVTYEEKRNKCGPLNPVCCDKPNSPWCDKNSGEEHNRSRDWGEEPTKRQMIRNFFASMLLAHGTPLLLGGDEWMRTQLGNNNAYSTQADNEFNWFQWGNWQAKDEAHRMHDFVRDMITLRKQYAWALAPTDYDEAAPFEWKNPSNAGAPVWDSRSLMLHYNDPPEGEPQLLIALNMARDWVDYTLPPGSWSRVVDTQAYFDDTEFLSENADDLKQSYNITLDNPEPIAEGTYRAAGSSIVVFVGE
jgi:glycogen operon protein